jgi:predicted aldo/keto reductase-like oxidoreductase
LYGSHPFIGKALKDKPRDSYAVISKIWWRPKGLQEDERPDADVVVARFLKELQSDYVDLVHLHCVMSANWPTELRKQMDILEDLKQKGKIKAHGVSCHSLEALSAAAEEPWVDAVNTRINPYGVKMDGPADKVVPVLKKLHEAGKGVVGMKIIGEGEFRNDEAKREESVKFAIGLGCVDAMVVGFENTGEMDEFKKRVAKALNEKK